MIKKTLLGFVFYPPPEALGGANFILLEVLLKPGDPYCGHFVSVSQSTTPVLTRGGFNPPKRKSRQKQTHANKHESWDTPKANRRKPQ